MTATVMTALLALVGGAVAVFAILMALNVALLLILRWRIPQKPIRFGERHPG